MKMIMLAVTITPHSAATVSDVLAALKSFGDVNVAFEGEVDEVPQPVDYYPHAIDSDNAMWLRVPLDSGDSWLQVDKPSRGWEKIKELSTHDMEDLTLGSVCVAFNARYPRADKYGTPLYASARMFALGFIGEEGFSVTENVYIQTEDSGDDSPEEMFFKIVTTI